MKKAYYILLLSFFISPFTNGCTHNHTYVKHEYVSPDCINNGHIEYYDCECGKLFLKKDNTYCEVETKDVVVPSLGHQMVIEGAVDVTCTSDGMTGRQYCSRCGEVVNENTVIPALGHSYSFAQKESIPHFYQDICANCLDARESVLPVINITTDSAITKEYVSCNVSTTSCLERYQIDATGQIKVRGNWTSTLPKKPYRIKFDKKQNLLGLNNELKAKSWVLLADYADKSMLRNATAFYLASQLFDGYYSSDCCFVEVFVNEVFNGIYLLAEQQQVGIGRVDIFEDKTVTSTDIGYLIEYDQYYNLESEDVVFEISYNDIPYFNDVIADESHFIKHYVIKNDFNNSSQKAFIQDRMQKIWDISYDAIYSDHFDKSINPYKTLNNNGEIIDDVSINSAYEALNKIIDIESLVDTYIFNEIVQDMDIGYSSFYMSLDMSGKGNKKLTFQAPWDFDWCFGNSVQNTDKLYLGNYLVDEPNHEKSNPWLLLISNAKWFWELMQEKWNIINTLDIKDEIVSNINTFTNDYSSYIDKEYELWSGKSTIIVWCSSSKTLLAKKQNQDAVNLVDYINDRFDKLDYYFEDFSRVSNQF